MGTSGYVQAYRDGTIEAVGRGVVSSAPHAGREDAVIFSADFEKNVVAMTLAYAQVQAKLGFGPPLAILVSLLDAGNARVDLGDWLEVPRVGRPCILFDEVVLEAVPADEQTIAQQLRPIFDQLANAGGRPRSRNFTASGEWQPKA